MKKWISFILAVGLISYLNAQDKPATPAKTKKDSTKTTYKVEANGKQVNIDDPEIQKLLKEKGIDLNNLDNYGKEEGKTTTTEVTDKGTRIINVYNVTGTEIPQEVQDMMNAAPIKSKGNLDDYKGIQGYEYSFEDQDGIRMNFLKILKDDKNDIYVWEDEKMPPDAKAAVDLFGIDPSVFREMADPFLSGNKASLGVGMRNGPGGVEITQVLENGGAQKSGMQAGDLIVSANGAATLDKATLSRILAAFDPYEKIMVGYVRETKQKMASVMLLPQATFLDQTVGKEGVLEGDAVKVKTEGDAESKEITIKKKTGSEKN